MHTFWLIVMSVVVAAIIGGLTNFVAIKMLFYPCEKKYLGPWKIPFTPGIIPKRRDEIAVSLGNIVSEHLVTQDSIRKVIHQSKTHEQLETYLLQTLEQLQATETTAGEWLYTNFAREGQSYEQWKEQLQQWIRELVQKGALSVWKNVRSKKLKELLPQNEVHRREEYAAKLSAWIVSEVEHYIRSPEGQYWLDGMLNNMLQRTSGLKGFIAGFFMGDPRLVSQISAWLGDGLQEPALRMKLQQVIVQRMDKWMELTAEDIEHSERLFDEISTWITDQIIHGRHVSALLDLKVGQCVSYVDELVRSNIPKWSHQLLHWAEQQLPFIMKRLNLPHLVQQQVSAFPIHQVERIVLEVSGREFRAITWLGALLGGMIGLIQSFVYLYLL